MADIELLAPGGHQKLVDEVEERLDLKADIDGYYAQLTAGAADNLTSRGDAVAAEYLYRTSGGTADIETGQATIKSISGNTLRWNQLNSRMNNAQQVAGLTRTINDDGSLTITGTASEDPNYNVLYLGNTISLKRDGRKYLFKASKPTGLNLRVSGHPATGQGQSFIWSSNIGTDWDGALSAYCEAGTEVNITNLKCMVIDLTTMFGSGNEPSTVAEFEALYPLPYYEYDAGSLLSVNMEGIETTGFNQWDEEWESGQYKSTDGAPTANSNKVRSKNPIPVFPSTEYYVKCPTSTTLYWYDAAGVYLGYVSMGVNATATTPANAHYMQFSVGSSSSPVTSITAGDVCINLHWSGRRDGEYEPYWSAQREIAAATYFPDGMRSAGTVRDELRADAAVTRVGVVDLGTLTWTTTTATGGVYRMSSTGISGQIKPPESNNTPANIRCTKYDTLTTSQTSTPLEGVSLSTYGNIVIYDPDYNQQSSVADFKAAMSGVLLFYELATPTTQTIDPPLNLSYKVDDWGTERVMVPTGEMSAPPVMEVAYGLNVVDFVRRAPTQYISAASFAQYLLARDAHDGTTTAMEWDETNGRYEFTITDVETEG